MATLQMPSYDLVVDTNALYSPAPKHLISPGFDAALAKIRGITGVTLFVPDIVRSELVAQRVRLAIRSRESLQKSGNNLRECTGFQPQRLPSDTVFRRRVMRQFNEWLERRDGEILRLPSSKSIWRRIVNDAVWRNPPFERPADEEGKSSEKGFKDALVCETVVNHVESSTSKPTVFVCKDTLLRVAVTNRLAGGDALIFSTVDELASHLELIQQNKTSEYAQQIIQAAAAAYYTPEKPDCLFHAFGIPHRIQQDFGSILEHPVDRGRSLLPKNQVLASLIEKEDILSGLVMAGTLVPISEEKYFQESTGLSEVKNGRIHWNTTQMIVRLFERHQPHKMAAFVLPFSNERIRIAKVAVKWSSEMGVEPVITSPKLETMKWIGEELEDASLINKMRHDFPLFPQVG